MKAGLPKLEPGLLARWEELGLYKKLRKASKGRKPYILHDGPPYANGHLHIGHALNKILKDVISRSQQMMGLDSRYVPGWDCHGLPIEWKIEEQYRAKGKNKDEVPINEFRKECREFAEKWVDIQREEFKRLGVEGDWENPYTTMTYKAEARIASELMKFAMNGTLYQGSKPVMWSVVERTALAEAEVEYHDYESDTIWVKFPFHSATAKKVDKDLSGASVVIWTTTPWTIPGNRAISFNPRIKYSVYEVTAAPDENWARKGDKFLLADTLADEVMQAARVDNFKRLGTVSAKTLEGMKCKHPLATLGYAFDIPLLAGDHVTDEDGTGFVHTAPGHGRDDFEIWMDNSPALQKRGIDTVIPFTVDGDGKFTSDAPGFEGKQVITEKGKKGDANQAVIAALTEADGLISRGRLKHQYPHSWRSKKPVIFRNTPQWFIAIDKPVQVENVRGKKTIRALTRKAVEKTRWVPAQSRNRIEAMVEGRPDWVISRQRAWGVPITVFRHKETGEILPNENFEGAEKLIKRIVRAFEKHGADAWFDEGAKARFLKGFVKPKDLDDWEQVTDILDVWFDSGSTHSFVLEDRKDLTWPADLYLEGTDQHRGWFLSSLFESCATRGRAPYNAVLTHGFILADDGHKMAKSRGNDVSPHDVIKQSGADILRLWVVSSDYSEDLRIGQEILKTNIDSYRKLRNTLRFLLGNLKHYEPSLRVEPRDMPELERYMLHRLYELDRIVRKGYDEFDFKRIFQALFNFATLDLSAFYFDVRKDALYCDPYDSTTRRASLTVLDELFSCLTAWLAPMLCFTMEEAWMSRGAGENDSIHLLDFPEIPRSWKKPAIAAKWQKIRQVRRVVTGALEIERREKRIGSSLEAAPAIYIDDDDLKSAFKKINVAEVMITSQASLLPGKAPKTAFRLEEVAGVAVVPHLAEGQKCTRSWKILPDIGVDPDYPDLSSRDAEAVRQFEMRLRARD